MAIKSNNFNVDKNGNMTCNNGKFTGGKVKLFGGSRGNANLVISEQEEYYNSNYSEILPGNVYISNKTGGNTGIYANADSANSHAYLYASNSGGVLVIGNSNASNFCVISGANSNMTIHGDIYANVYNYNSLSELKKNIKKYKENAIKIVKEGEIYEFNYNTENDKHKKHIGFIIGKEYKTPKIIVSENEKGIDSYSMASILWQAVKELSQKVEELENKLKEEKQ